MNYLVCMLILALLMFVFLRILAIFQRGEWPSEQVSSVEGALRELIVGRRPRRNP
jgi:hypothetical protein